MLSPSSKCIYHTAKEEEEEEEEESECLTISKEKEEESERLTTSKTDEVESECPTCQETPPNSRSSHLAAKPAEIKPILSTVKPRVEVEESKCPSTLETSSNLRSSPLTMKLKVDACLTSSRPRSSSHPPTPRPHLTTKPEATRLKESKTPPILRNSQPTMEPEVNKYLTTQKLPSIPRNSGTPPPTQHPPETKEEEEESCLPPKTAATQLMRSLTHQHYSSPPLDALMALISIGHCSQCASECSKRTPSQSQNASGTTKSSTPKEEKTTYGEASFTTPLSKCGDTLVKTDRIAQMRVDRVKKATPEKPSAQQIPKPRKDPPQLHPPPSPSSSIQTHLE
jgi:hypothetical protein